MKPFETIIGSKHKYSAIMFLCLIYAGFALLSFGFQIYGTAWRLENAPASPPIFNRGIADSNNDLNIAAGALRPERMQRQSITEVLTSPYSLTLLFSGITSLLAGLSIWRLTREKEIKKIKNELADSLLLPEEKKIINALKSNNFDATQAKLAKDTGLSKVQVHRTIRRLEDKKVIEKHKFGMTNKIILKKELLE